MHPSVRTPRATLRLMLFPPVLLAPASGVCLARVSCAPSHCSPRPSRAQSSPVHADSTSASSRGPLAAAIPRRAPYPACCLFSPHLSLSISRPLPLTAERLPSLFPNPERRRYASPPPPLLMVVGRTCRGASGRPWPSLGHP
jgi:hypothetical protein